MNSYFISCFIATDVLLSHLITFLNDKVDWRLRAAFFECCPIVAHMIGRQGTYILQELLLQVHNFEFHIYSIICTVVNILHVNVRALVPVLNIR